MNSDFEKRLQEQPMREVPGEWRARILAASPAASSTSVWWRQWLWPCPQAWAGLGAAWLLILGMNLAAGDGPAHPATATVAFSRQELADLRQQQAMLAEIIFPVETAEPPKLNPSPRSEMRRTEVVV